MAHLNFCHVVLSKYVMWGILCWRARSQRTTMRIYEKILFCFWSKSTRKYLIFFFFFWGITRKYLMKLHGSFFIETSFGTFRHRKHIQYLVQDLAVDLDLPAPFPFYSCRSFTDMLIFCKIWEWPMIYFQDIIKCMLPHKLFYTCLVSYMTIAKPWNMTLSLK